MIEDKIKRSNRVNIEKILSDSGLYIYKHLNDKEMAVEYFYDYNTLNPKNKIIASKGVAYCYAVKKHLK